MLSGASSEKAARQSPVAQGWGHRCPGKAVGDSGPRLSSPLAGGRCPSWRAESGDVKQGTELPLKLPSAECFL